MTESEQPQTPPRKWRIFAGRPILWGAVSGWLLIFIPYLAALALHRGDLSVLTYGNPVWSYTVGLILLMPAVQAFVSALKYGAAKRSWIDGITAVFFLWVLDVLAAAIILREGVLCVIMAAPLLWAILAVGYVIGRVIVRIAGAGKASVSLMPLLALAAFAEASGPAPNAAYAVSDSVVVAAPRDYVWRYVVDYPDNPTPPKYWLWSIGLPYPTHSVAPVQAVGARRDCKFSGGQAFEERIAVLEPGKRLVFDITKQPQNPEIIGHMTVDRGEIDLLPNADGTTTIVATSWYRLHVRPAGYFNLWAEDVTRRIHVRVLGYMKTLAERDYRAAKGKAS
ncbi:SRPBCC family protein [Asticcacaulis solisilvae]|uniref:SRPBCC family protein n=1 Tax=Asticcacaulis solisilvae TaxID=1217274 RepID=UPI003FD70DE2